MPEITLKRKPDVEFGEYTLPMIHMLAIVYAAAQVCDFPVVVTSCRDGRHSANSRHYKGEAIDIRSHVIQGAVAKEAFRKSLEDLLGPQFRVLLEGLGTPNEHFHAQTKKGHTYRPALIVGEVVA
jgi:hypothetical protein